VTAAIDAQLVERRKSAVRAALAELNERIRKCLAVIREWFEHVAVPLFRRIAAFLEEIGWMDRWRQAKRTRISRMHSSYGRRRR